MLYFDQLDWLSKLVGGETCPSQSSYYSLSATENGSSRRHLHYHHHKYHHKLLKLIFLSVALTGGCLCYLTIYYQLTTLVATKTEPELVHSNQISNQTTQQYSSVMSSLPTFSSSSLSFLFSSTDKKTNINFVKNVSLLHQSQSTISNNPQLYISYLDNSINNQTSNNNNFWTASEASEISAEKILVDEKINDNNILEETSLNQQHLNDHVSEYLSEHVQLLAVKAAHRLEVLLHEVELILTEIKSKQFSINTCPQVIVFFANIDSSDVFQSSDVTFSLLPPFYKSQLLTAQITSTIFSTLTSNTVSTLSQCDVLLLFSCQQNRKNYDAQKMTSVTLLPLLHQQKMPLFLPNRAFVNSFSFLENLLSSQSKLCTLFKTVQLYPVFDNSKLPFKHSFCDTSMTTLDKNVYMNSNKEKLKNYDVHLKLSNNKFTHSEIILVTSINPLRAFTYKDNKLKQNQNLSADVEKQIKLTLLTTLVWFDIAEQIMPANEKKIKILPLTTTATHFHLLKFDFEILNNEKVTLLNVTNYQYLASSENSNSFLPFHKYILNDVLKLLCTATPSKTIFKLKSELERLLRSDELGLQGVNCHQSHRACLTTEDFQYLLDTLAQTSIQVSDSADQNEFKLLYPLLSLKNNDDESFLTDYLEKLFEKNLLLFADRQKQQLMETEPEQPDEFFSAKASRFEYLTERMFSVGSLLNWKVITSDKNEFAGTTEASTEGNGHPNNADYVDYQHQHSYQHDTSGIHDLTNLNSMYHSGGDGKADQLAPPLDSALSDKHQHTLHNCTVNCKQLSTLSKFSVLLPLYISLDESSLPKQQQSSDEKVKKAFSFDEHHLSYICHEHVVQNGNAQHYHYEASGPVNYGDLLLSLDIAVAHCDAWIKLEDQVLFQSGTLNFTLGLGKNVITFSLVTKADGKSVYHVINTYTITINRLSREEQYYSPMPPTTETDNENMPLEKEICSIDQDCEMAVFGDSIPCGLQPTGFKTTIYGNEDWAKNLDYADNIKLNNCSDGAASGHWLVPCYSCNQESTCSWAAIQWKPTSCQYQIPVPSDQLMKCFKTKKHLLIIGDSTNRGILNYIVERINGTLTEADKTHNWKQYQLKLKTINGAISEIFEMTVTFVYYPKFWIPLQKRLSFDEVLKQLLKNIFNSNKKTFHDDGKDFVIVVGGVQWIAHKHLLTLKEQIQFFNISNTKIVIKSLGSGFHQPVNGVHYMPLVEQKKLSVHNAELIEEARKLKFGIVDTFNKTIALYRDFYPGKCACHFHKIINKPLKKQDRYQSNQLFSYKTSVQQKLLQHHQHLYHVEGRLNQLYSEILLLEICK